MVVGVGLLQCNEGPGFYCGTCFQNNCTNLFILYKVSLQIHFFIIEMAYSFKQTCEIISYFIIYIVYAIFLFFPLSTKLHYNIFTTAFSGSLC